MFELEKNVKSLPEMNESLKNVTNKINNFHQTAKNSILAISCILAEISNDPNKYLFGSGFDKIVDYTESLFGYKKAYTYKLIKISKFITIADKNGKKLDVGYILNDNLIQQLIDNDNFIQFKTIQDSDGFEYSTSQLLELIPLSQEQIEQNINELDSSLSCKELREVVKDIINPPIQTTAGDTVTDDTTDTSEAGTTPEIYLTDKERIMQMLEMCSKIQNEEIKALIINVFQKAIKRLEKINPTQTA